MRQEYEQIITDYLEQFSGEEASSQHLKNFVFGKSATWAICSQSRSTQEISTQLEEVQRVTRDAAQQIVTAVVDLIQQSKKLRSEVKTFLKEIKEA